MRITSKMAQSGTPSAAPDGKHIDDWRDHIDQLDERLIQVLAERMRVVKALHAYKLGHHMPLYSAERERNVLAHARQIADAHGLDADLAESLFLLIARWFASPGD